MTKGKSDYRPAKKACGTCGGTGWIICLNSIFVTEKTRKERCGICGGSKCSSYRDDSAYVRWQSRCRDTFPYHPDYEAFGALSNRLASGGGE